MRPFFAFCVFLFSAALTFAQQNISFRDQKKFAQHLFDDHLYDECVQVINDCRTHYVMDPIVQDSMQELEAECFSRLLQYDSAAVHYREVVADQDLVRFRLHACYSFSRSGKFSSAVDCLPSIIPGDTIRNELNYYFGRCLSLLQGRKSFEQNDQLIRPPQSNYFIHKTGELKSYALRLKKAGRKSMFLAGLMSAVVPGTGKIYAGKWRAGLTSFVPIAVMGLEAWEAYKKDGWKSVRFAVFGSLFGVFYIGNIWGSALSVSVQRREIENEIHSEILLGMHISLQHVFGESR
ncbi:MAG TPA: hypothetical protein VI112_07525 [Bacteroidia bacterium]|jgi:hypothetical protein